MTMFLTFFTLSPGSGGGGGGVSGQNICYHVAAFQFWPFDPIPGDGGDEGGGVGVCGHNISYHVAAFVILFNLICNMTMFWKSLIITFFIPSAGSGRGLRAKLLLPCCCIWWFSLIWYTHGHVLQKLNFNLLTPSPGLGRDLRAKYLLPCCCIWWFL